MVWVFLLLIFLSGPAKADDNSAKFYVERVTVFSKYDSAFALELANSILPPNKAANEVDVRCLISVLEGSGLYDQIKIKWEHPGKDIRRLALYLNPEPGREDFIVSRVSLVDLPEVAPAEFLKRMAEKGIVTGSPLLHFTYKEINDMADDSIRGSVSPELAKEAGGSAWVSFKPDGQGKIEVIVSANMPQCSH